MILRSRVGTKKKEGRGAITPSYFVLVNSKCIGKIFKIFQFFSDAFTFLGFKDYKYKKVIRPPRKIYDSSLDV